MPNRTGNSGEVTISANVHWRDPFNKQPINRAAIVFHELQENYLRTSERMKYLPAHQDASKIAAHAFIPNDPRYSSNPGYAERVLKPF